MSTPAPKTDTKTIGGSASITKIAPRIPQKGKASNDDRLGDMLFAKENQKRLERTAKKLELLNQKKTNL